MDAPSLPPRPPVGSALVVAAILAFASSAAAEPTKDAARPPARAKTHQGRKAAKPKTAKGGDQASQGPVAPAGDDATQPSTTERTTSSSSFTLSPEAPPRDAVAAPDDRDEQRDPLAARVRLSVGGGVVGRAFDYRDPLSPNLRSYSVPAATLVSVSAVAMPLGGDAPGGARVGVAGSYARSLGMLSAVPDGSTVATTYDRWEAGARVERVPSPTGRLGVLGLLASYSVTRFLFADETVGPLLPEAGYGSATVSGDIALRLPGFELGFVAGVGAVPQTGVSGRRFPHARGGVARGAASVTVPLGSHVGARLSGSYERFFLSMNPEPGDRFVAGGALDQYLRGGLEVLVGL